MPTDRMEIEGYLTSLENSQLAEALYPFDSGVLSMSLYVELLDAWESIPPKTRDVFAVVAASLRRQYYRELQADIEATASLARLRRGAR